MLTFVDLVYAKKPRPTRQNDCIQNISYIANGPLFLTTKHPVALVLSGSIVI